MIPVLVLASSVLLVYTALIYFLRKRHDQFLEETPYPQTASEAHPFTVRYMYGDFNFIAGKALEFGLFKTYGFPSISKLLHSTKELVDRCGKRYDDTDILVREIMEREPDAPRAKAAINRMNFIHSQYKISNPDYLYVLSVFIVEPIRWVERFGFRSPHEKERYAMHLRWKIIGQQMGIKDIPETYEETERYLDAYEEKHMVYADANSHVAHASIDLFLSILPRKLRPMCKPAVYALCPAHLRKAMGFPTPPWPLVFFIELSLKAAGLFVKYLMPPRTVPKYRTSPQPVAVSNNILLYPLFHPFEKTYMHGYKISELGPERFCPMSS